MTIEEAMAYAQGFEAQKERETVLWEMAKSRNGANSPEARQHFLKMTEAKQMLEEYYGYDTKRGHYEQNEYGEREWVETTLEHHDGIITVLANEALRIKERSNLGKRFADRTFANFEKRRDPQAYNQCLAYSNRENLFSEKRNSLMIFGPVGSGKTHLSASIANDFAERGIPTLFGTYSEHLEHIKDEFDSAGANEYLRDMKTMMVLVIDDIGKEKQTEWTQQILFDVVNYRYEHLLPIIITTNFSAEQLAEYVGHPVWSRLYEMSNGVTTAGSDYRQIG